MSTVLSLLLSTDITHVLHYRPINRYCEMLKFSFFLQKQDGSTLTVLFCNSIFIVFFFKTFLSFKIFSETVTVLKFKTCILKQKIKQKRIGFMIYFPYIFKDGSLA